MQVLHCLGLLLLVVTLLLHTSGSVAVAQSPAPGGATVTMKEFEFTPKEVKVQVGATVTWTNAGTTAHSATPIDRAFNTRNLQPEAIASQTML